MDRWKFFAITHADHVICNPISEAGIEVFIEALDLPRAGRVLDMGCGKGEVLLRVAERYGVSGVGVDVSPYFIGAARERAAGRQVDVGFVEADGIAYRDEPGSFDAACCLGASFIFGGYRKTLRALKAFARPGGVVACGEPYSLEVPERELFPDAPERAFASDAGNVEIGREEGLDLVTVVPGTREDFDRYIDMQYPAVERYLAEHPDDPDGAEIVRWAARAREEFEAKERGKLGWSIYVFRRPAPGETHRRL
jgi:SAM-dependent methyltransferase